MSRSQGRSVSVWNWMLTLILAAIPGVNLVAMICFAIWGRARAKRSFAIAWIVLAVLCCVLAVVALFVFPEQVRSAADWLRSDAAQLFPEATPAPTVLP